MSNESDIRRRFWTELAHSPFLMVDLKGSGGHSMPMTAQLDPGANHCFWFYTSRANRLAAGGPAMAHFAGKGHFLFACIEGTLVAENDPVVIDRYWTHDVASWYADGRQDREMLMMRFDLGHAEIWRADMSLGGMFRQMFGGDVREEMRGKHVEVTL
jgi:general stress protein 26